MRTRLFRRSRPRLHWWRDVPNFGDLISPFLLASVCGTEPIWVPADSDHKILGVGSIASSVNEGDVVWGAGCIDDTPVVPPKDVTFLAVRGPLTRERISADVPEVYGDPAMLLPRYYQPNTSSQQNRVGIVPHYVDLGLVDPVDDPSLLVIDVGQPWRDVIDQICSCEVIVSSSLHGIIAAEAYGIPTAWVRISDQILGGNFKFHDYLLSTRREPIEPVEWSAGLGAAVGGCLPEPRWDPSPLLEASSHLTG